MACLNGTNEHSMVKYGERTDDGGMHVLLGPQSHHVEAHP